MKLWQFGIVVIVMIGLIFGLIMMLPQQEVFLYQVGLFLLGVWRVFHNILVTLWILAGSALIGWFCKAYMVNIINGIWDNHEVMQDWMRHVLSVLFALVVAVLWIVTMPYLIQPWNWMYWVSVFLFHWSGVFEVPPIWWGVYSLIPFFAAWWSTDHEAY